MLNDLFIISLDKDAKFYLKNIEQVSGTNPETGQVEQFMSFQKTSYFPEARIFFSSLDAMETLRKVRLSGCEDAVINHFKRTLHSIEAEV